MKNFNLFLIILAILSIIVTLFISELLSNREITTKDKDIEVKEKNDYSGKSNLITENKRIERANDSLTKLLQKEADGISNKEQKSNMSSGKNNELLSDKSTDKTTKQSTNTEQKNSDIYANYINKTISDAKKAIANKKYDPALVIRLDSIFDHISGLSREQNRNLQKLSKELKMFEPKKPVTQVNEETKPENQAIANPPNVDKIEEKYTYMTNYVDHLLEIRETYKAIDTLRKCTESDIFRKHKDKINEKLTGIESYYKLEVTKEINDYVKNWPYDGSKTEQYEARAAIAKCEDDVIKLLDDHRKDSIEYVEFMSLKSKGSPDGNKTYIFKTGYYINEYSIQINETNK